MGSQVPGPVPEQHADAFIPGTEFSTYLKKEGPQLTLAPLLLLLLLLLRTSSKALGARCMPPCPAGGSKPSKTWGCLGLWVVNMMLQHLQWVLQMCLGRRSQATQLQLCLRVSPSTVGSPLLTHGSWLLCGCSCCTMPRQQQCWTASHCRSCRRGGSRCTH